MVVDHLYNEYGDLFGEVEYVGYTVDEVTVIEGETAAPGARDGKEIHFSLLLSLQQDEKPDLDRDAVEESTEEAAS